MTGGKKGEITCKDRYPSAMKTVRKNSGYFCLNNKEDVPEE